MSHTDCITEYIKKLREIKQCDKILRDIAFTRGAQNAAESEIIPAKKN